MKKIRTKCVCAFVIILVFICISTVVIAINRIYNSQACITEHAENVNDDSEYYPQTNDDSTHNCMGWNEESINEYLSSHQSDIEGLTMLEKTELGLSHENGSDTDHDGLTDKEEIEIYGSDPLKASTAGDLYTDGYKAEHDMDINTYYEYQNDREFTLNKCSEVTLYATKATDFGASVTKYDVAALGRSDATELLENKSIYAEYVIDNYSGNVSIDLSKLDKDVNTKKLSVYRCSWTGYDVENIPYTIDENQIMIEDAVESGSMVLILLEQ